MNAKIKILSTGDATYMELDGKSMGHGVESVSFSHDSNGVIKMDLSIDLKRFSFMPDGYFSETERQLAKENPPGDLLNGRVE